MSSAFLQFYYQTVSTNKPALQQVFREGSEMTVECEHFRGLREIAAKLAGAEGAKPVPDGSRSIATLDAVPLGAGGGAGAPSCMVALVTGSIALAGEANPLAFAQAFVLVNDASGSYCSDDLFQFHYG
jgi:hypothetical protein